ncbi:MASE1 domain-containing protein [Flindersiella endophytica]
MTRSTRLRPQFLVAIQIAAVAVAYFLSAELGLQLALVNHQVSPLWPPTGIALVCLLMLGFRTIPGIAIGAFFANELVDPNVLAAAAIAIGNTLAPLTAYVLLRRARFRIELDRFRDGLALVFLGAFAGMLVSASLGSAVLLLRGTLEPADFWTTWWIWWAGDAMGVLIIAPLLLLARNAKPPKDVPPIRWLEFGTLAAGTFTAAVLASGASYHLLYLVFPFLVWAAIRFQLAGSAPCALIVSLVAIFAAAGHYGPFSDHSDLVNMVTLQTFNGSMSLTALLLAVVTTQRNNARRQIEEAVGQLANAVTTLGGASRYKVAALLGRVDDPE